MEMRGSGPYQHCELEGSLFGSWFSRPRLVDRLPLPVLRPARIPGLRASILASYGSSVPPRLVAQRTTVMAPAIGSRLRSRWPILDILPNPGLPPEGGVHSINNPSMAGRYWEQERCYSARLLDADQ